jgi:hypothetical protein
MVSATAAATAIKLSSSGAVDHESRTPLKWRAAFSLAMGALSKLNAPIAIVRDDTRDHEDPDRRS